VVAASTDLMADIANPGQLLGAIFSASPDAVVVIDGSGRIMLSSPAVSDLFGYFPEELVGEPLEVLIPTDRRTRHVDHIRRFFDSPVARQMGAGLQLAGRRRDGTTFAVDVSLTPVEVRGARYAAAFVRDARERQRDLDRLHAVNEITQRLLGGANLSEVLSLVAERARRLSSAEAVWIVTPASDGHLPVTAAAGPRTGGLLGVVLSGETSRSAEVMRTGSSQVVEDLSTAGNVPDAVAMLDLGPGLYVPLIADERRLGALLLGRARGSPQFGALDVAFADLFASASAAAIELNDVRAELGRLEIASEDERIARDLHDTVIQQLFAVGMALQASRAAAVGPVRERIDSAVDDLDAIIREIRNTIFRLPGRRAQVSSLREEVLRLANKHGDELGFVIRVAFDGPVETSVPESVTEQILQVLTEALSNTVRHARASRVEVVLAVAGGWFSLSVIDDGKGMPGGATAGSGLRNMVTRATNLGGTFTASPHEPIGTIVEWRVPI